MPLASDTVPAHPPDLHTWPRTAVAPPRKVDPVTLAPVPVWIEWRHKRTGEVHVLKATWTNSDVAVIDTVDWLHTHARRHVLGDAESNTPEADIEIVHVSYHRPPTPHPGGEA